MSAWTCGFDSHPGHKVRFLNLKKGRLAQLAEHLAYIEEVAGSSPAPSTRKSRGSSVVEHFSEKEGVVSSILTRGTMIAGVV